MLISRFMGIPTCPRQSPFELMERRVWRSLTVAIAFLTCTLSNPLGQIPSRRWPRTHWYCHSCRQERYTCQCGCTVCLRYKNNFMYSYPLYWYIHLRIFSFKCQLMAYSWMLAVPLGVFHNWILCQPSYTKLLYVVPESNWCTLYQLKMIVLKIEGFDVPDYVLMKIRDMQLKASRPSKIQHASKLGGLLRI